MAQGTGSLSANAGGCPLNPVTAVDAIRDRAGVGHVDSRFTGSVDDFMSELRRERAVELSFEGHRFNDLRRWLLLDKAPYNQKKGVYFDRGMSDEEVYADPQNARVLNIREEVIVQRGFGEKQDMMGGVSEINMKELLQKNYSGDGLGALVAGYDGALWGQSPLVLIDGMPRDLSKVDMTQVETITYLKAASAVLLYGSRASKGAILVTTKRDWFNPMLPVDRMDMNNLDIRNYVENSNHLIDGKYLLGGLSTNTGNALADAWAAGYVRDKNRDFMFKVALDADLSMITKGLRFRTAFNIDYWDYYSEAYSEAYAVYEPTHTSITPAPLAVCTAWMPRSWVGAGRSRRLRMPTTGGSDYHRTGNVNLGLATAEYVSSFATLKECKAGQDMTLAISMAPNEFLAKTTRYSLADRNFDAVAATGGINMASCMASDGFN